MYINNISDKERVMLNKVKNKFIMGSIKKYRRITNGVALTILCKRFLEGKL